MFKKIGVLLLSGIMMVASLSAVSVNAAPFTPSVTAKPAPTIAKMKNQKGEEVMGIIYNQKGEEVYSIQEDDIQVTPASQQNAENQVVQEMVSMAIEQLSAAENFEQLAPGFDALLEKMNIDEQDLLVKDLFDLFIAEKPLESLQVEGNALYVQFEVDIPKDAPLIIIKNSGILNGDKWDIVPQSNITRHNDNTMTVEFKNLSPIAFMTTTTDLPLSPDGPTSPQTGNTSFPYLAICFVAFGVFGIVLFVRKKFQANME